ncbi:hypothetical protein C8E87_7179 [Paractinoplanes brasiliensis]|uniref:Uncharacterized protein n=1 Tax=Paractinoplanes brasiliensis TaxID=52695 RepID=A0A4R6J873_9ACTN|nr:hypothetical protein C8E87_7179 [Actinoplanes brasiliensis]
MEHSRCCGNSRSARNAKRQETARTGTPAGPAGNGTERAAMTAMYVVLQEAGDGTWRHLGEVARRARAF